MIEVKYLKKGQPVHFFDSKQLKPVESLIADVHIKIDESTSQAKVTYTVKVVDSADLRLDSSVIFETKEEITLESF